MAEYNAAILSISLMTLLGFVDDVLNLRWRYKLIVPFVFTLPLIQAYVAQKQSTTIALPSYLHSLEQLAVASWAVSLAHPRTISLFWAS